MPWPRPAPGYSSAIGGSYQTRHDRTWNLPHHPRPLRFFFSEPRWQDGRLEAPWADDRLLDPHRRRGVHRRIGGPLAVPAPGRRLAGVSGAPRTEGGVHQVWDDPG